MATKRQHLIWRKYLSPWTDNVDSNSGNIVCYDKVNNKIIKNVSLENIGVQKYIYDISMINDSDKKAATQYFDMLLNNRKLIRVKSKITDSADIFKKDFIENNFICPIENNGIRFLEKLYKGEFPFEGPTELEKILDLLKFNMLNTLFSNESLFPDIEIQKSLNLGLLIYNCEDLRYDFFEFIAAQMFRTWRSKETILNSIKQTVEKFEDSCFNNTTMAIFPLMMIANTQLLASAFCENNFYIELIRNETSQNFITSDFPLINLCADYNNSCETVNELELFYPIAPRCAIICKNSIRANTTTTIDDSTIVDAYNKKIFYAATKQVYAVKEEDLSDIICKKSER